MAEEMITIPKWQMVKIEDTLRICSNIHHSFNKETCFDRMVCKAWNWSKSALGMNVDTEESNCNKAAVLGSLPDENVRYHHNVAEEISIILDKYEATCPLERQEIIDEINMRFVERQ